MMMKKAPRFLKKLIIYFLCFYLSFAGPLVTLASATAYYADAARSDDSGDGTTWATAEQTIGAALTDTGSSGDVVCVKAGTYSGALSPKAGRSLYGAAADDTTKDTYCTDGGSASFPSGTSTVSSMITYSDNGTSSTTVLDGFTITNGSESGIRVYAALPEYVVSPTITNNTITGNNFHGVHVSGSSGTASPTLTNNTITGNNYNGVLISASSGGTASPTLTNNTITGNVAHGVLIFAYYATAFPTLTNNTITGNKRHGVYIFTSTSVATVINPDLGGGSDTGHNTIKDNADADVDPGADPAPTPNPYSNANYYDLKNDSDTTISAINNWWKTTPPNIDSGSPEHIHNDDGGVNDVVNADPNNSQTLAFSISPSSGDEAGGTTVTITASANTFFVENAGALVDNNNISVTFGGTDGTVTFNSSTSLSVITPAGSPGTADVVVTNPAGQTGTLSSTYIYDSTAPTAAITYSATSPYKSGDTVTITATFNEAMADSPVPQIAITGSNTVSATAMTRTSSTVYTYSHTVASGDGTATVALSTGTDDAGNVITSTPTSGATFTVDNAAPTVSAGADSTTNAQITQDATVTGATSYQWSDVGSTGNITFGSAISEDTTISASVDGTYTIRLTATDDAGNSASDDMTLTWDTTAPSTTVSVSGGAYTSTRSVTLTCADNSGGSGCDKTYYTTNGSSPTTSSTQYASAITISTSTTLKYFSTDTTGNREKTKKADYFIVPAGTPTLSVTPASLAFASSTSEMNLDISNTGGGEMSWSVTSDKDWLTMKNPSGLTQSYTSRRIVKVNRSGLSAGDYAGTITVNAGDAGIETISVTMTISGSPALAYAPSQINFGHLRTQASLYITNIGTNTLDWTISTTSSWLTFDRSSGSVTTENDRVTMTIDRDLMTTGANTGTIDLFDGTNTTNIPVTAYKPDSGVAFTSMTTNPSNLDADGSSTSTITATFSGCANQAVTFSTGPGDFSGSSSTTVTADASSVATATYTASSTTGIAVIKAVCNGVFGAGTVNLSRVSFTNAETEIPGTGADTIDKRSTIDLSMDKNGYGTPPVTLAIYSFNPSNTFENVPVGNYFDMNFESTDDVDSVTIKKWVTSEDMSGLREDTIGLYYANGAEWEVCSNTGYVASASGSYVGYIYATFTSSTTPTIDYLDGLALVGGEGAVSIPTLTEWGMLVFVLLLLLSSIIFIRGSGYRGRGSVKQLTVIKQQLKG